MKRFLCYVVLMTVLILTLNSCSSVEELISQNPQLYHLQNTECLTAYADCEDDSDDESNGQYRYGTFQMTYRENPTICDCKFNSLNYPCDFGKVNIKITYSEGTLTIVEYPSSDTADCKCQVDASFTLKDLPLDDFQLKIYHGDTSGNYNPNKPMHIGSGRSIASCGIIEVKYQL